MIGDVQVTIRAKDLQRRLTTAAVAVPRYLLGAIDDGSLANARESVHVARVRQRARRAIEGSDATDLERPA